MSFLFCIFTRKKKKNSNHIEEKINEIIPINTKCKRHPKIPLSLFDIEEKSNSY